MLPKEDCEFCCEVTCHSCKLFNIFYFHLPVFADTGNFLLLAASRNQIVANNITSQSQHVYSLVRDGTNIVAIDFDSVTERIFWSDTSQDKIWSAFQNGTDRKIVRLLLNLHGISL